MSPTACEAEKAVITLAAGNNDGVNASVPVRWCLNKAAFGTLENAGVLEPLALIVVARQVVPPCDLEICPRNCERWEELGRCLVPAEKCINYTTFRRSGLYRVFVEIVWADKDHSPEKIYFERNYNNKWTRGLLTEKGEIYNIEPSKSLGVAGSIDIRVDSEFFAEEPPAWLKQWANYGFKKGPKDECAFRKRVIWAFTAKAPFILAWWTLKVIVNLVAVMTLALLGFKVDPIKAFKPWQVGMLGGAIFDYRLRNVFLYDPDYKQRPIFMVGLWPIWFVVAALILWKTNFFEDLSSIGLASLAAYVGIFVAVLVGSLGIAYPLMFWWDKRERARERTAYQKKLLARERKIEELRTVLVCTGGPLKADVGALPKERQTVSLRFTAWLADICRPYEQR